MAGKGIFFSSKETNVLPQQNKLKSYSQPSSFTRFAPITPSPSAPSTSSSPSHSLSTLSRSVSFPVQETQPPPQYPSLSLSPSPSPSLLLSSSPNITEKSYNKPLKRKRAKSDAMEEKTYCY